MEFTYGNNKGRVIPVSVDENGAVYIKDRNFKLVKSIEIDLTIERNKEELKIMFDSFAVAYPDSQITIYIDDTEENSKMTIKNNISVEVSASKIFISNEAKQGTAQIWFFKKEEM